MEEGGNTCFPINASVSMALGICGPSTVLWGPISLFSCWQAGMDQNMTLKSGEKCKMNLHLMFLIKHIMTLIYKNKMQLEFKKFKSAYNFKQHDL